MTRWDAVIVGAGPAGSATALLLARAGRSVLLLDRARFPREKPCSEFLNPAALPILDRLGVRADVERATHAKVYGMKVVAPDGRAALGRYGTSGAPLHGIALSRFLFDEILRAGAERAGAVVRESTTVEALLYEDGAVGGVVTRGENGREVIPARVVVGADGIRSVVARRLGAQRAGRPRRVAFTAQLAGVSGLDDHGELHVGGGDMGYVGGGPIGGGVASLALVLPVAAVRPRDRDYRRDYLDALDRFPGLRGRLSGARLVRDVLVTGPFARWSRPPVADGALLVGDAADFFDPCTAQGICSALRGAELAADALLAALADAGQRPLAARALAPYRRARRAVFGSKWALERMIGLWVGWPALANRVVDRLARRTGLADLFVGATGGSVPAGAALSPRTLVHALW